MEEFKKTLRACIYRGILMYMESGQVGEIAEKLTERYAKDLLEKARPTRSNIGMKLREYEETAFLNALICLRHIMKTEVQKDEGEGDVQMYNKAKQAEVFLKCVLNESRRIEYPDNVR